MFLMNHDFFDRFDVSFTKKESILSGKIYPLGYFANYVLEMDRSIFREISRKVDNFKYEFNIFLSARDVTSAALANEALLSLWELIAKLPVYRLVCEHDNKVNHLISYMREHPDEVDDMMTTGTARNQMLNLWLYNLENLVPSIKNFIQKTDFMLENYFENLPSRKAESYVRAYAKYKRDIVNGYDIADQEDKDTAELDLHQLTFPFSLSFAPKQHPKTKEVFLAEVITFGTLESFLYTDLMKAIATGNVPRKCHNCGKYFLAVGGYDTVYCERIAPDEKTKTCRKVGAHKKEKEKNGSSMIQKEYAKVYNRLKTRKNRGTISIDEWNEKVSLAQELKEKVNGGEISDVKYKALMDRI
ncbi:MAG: DUF6076 domain-containing protein [Faecalibacterium sp.]